MTETHVPSRIFAPAAQDAEAAKKAISTPQTEAASYRLAYQDEEFLLRATMPANLVDAMQAAGPAPRTYDPTLRPVLDLIRSLCARDLSSITVEKAGFRLELN